MSYIDSPLTTIINDAIARSVFVQAWGSAKEEAGITYRGQDLFEVAPPTPEHAKLTAAYLTGLIEGANKLPFASIYAHACAADGLRHEGVCAAARGEFIEHEDDCHTCEQHLAHARDFGHSLGLMALGSGAGWFDTHKSFRLNDGLNPPRELKVPLIEYHIDEFELAEIDRRLRTAAGCKLATPRTASTERQLQSQI
jgi:predicted transcriptional regulator